KIPASGVGGVPGKVNVAWGMAVLTVSDPNGAPVPCGFGKMSAASLTSPVAPLRPTSASMIEAVGAVTLNRISTSPTTAPAAQWAVNTSPWQMLFAGQLLWGALGLLLTAPTLTAEGGTGFPPLGPKSREGV